MFQELMLYNMLTLIELLFFSLGFKRFLDVAGEKALPLSL